MARRSDTMWRDPALIQWHVDRNIPFPAPGMGFPMIEYDRGIPVGIVSYMRRGERLPKASDVAHAYRSFSNLASESVECLPFLTVVYDPRNWAYKLFGHNESARRLIGGAGWFMSTEEGFAGVLYGMRGRTVPDLRPYGVELSQEAWLDGWLAEDAGLDQPPTSDAGLAGGPFPHSAMSTRRRNFEPKGQVRANWRIPCVDIDLACVHPKAGLTLLVDYKAKGARIDVTNTNCRALGSLFRRTESGLKPIVAVVTEYEWRDDGRYVFDVSPINRAAHDLMGGGDSLLMTEAGWVSATAQ